MAEPMPGPGRIPGTSSTDHPRTAVRRRPLVAALLGLVLVGLAIGSAARSGVERTPLIPPGVLATARLLDVTLDPRPRVQYEVIVDNHGTAPVLVTAIAVHQGDRTPQVSSYRQAVPASGTAVVPVTSALTCGGGRDQEVELRLVVHTGERPEDSEGAVLAAVPTGAAIGAGPCALAATRLPQGWSRTAVAQSVDLRADGATLTVSGLTTPGPVLAVRADAWSFALTGPSGVSPQGTVTLRLGKPESACWEWLYQTTVPAGLELVQLDQVTYLPIGPRLSRWLLNAYGAACS
ncbi:MAG: hypothetical protein WAL50_12120 [Kineosporiaceae bacterium]